MGSVLFIVPYPVCKAPSQRFRVELFEPYLQENNIHYAISSFMSKDTWNSLYRKGSAWKKVSGILKGYLGRLKTVLIDVHSFEYVFVHREAAPLGPPIFEWIVAKLWRKKLIYDFDDAIWIPNTSKENKLAGWAKCFWKVKYICKWSYKVVCGNEYLCQYANQYNDNVIRIPTCVDMERMHAGTKQHSSHKPVIGWTGSHSTLPYLNDVIDIIRELQESHDFTFLVIADKAPDISLKDWQFVAWSEATEISDLLKMDIGIMPLHNDEWSEGKCGFKLIQYLSLGIPAIASPVGVNKTIIEDGANGYLCYNKNDWKSKLQVLLSDVHSREKFGENGQRKMQQQFSVKSQLNNFISLFS